jgi:hypothetical protein
MVSWQIYSVKRILKKNPEICNFNVMKAEGRASIARVARRNQLRYNAPLACSITSQVTRNSRGSRNGYFKHANEVFIRCDGKPIDLAADEGNPMSNKSIFVAALVLAMSCFLQAGLAAGDKKKPEPAKDMIFDDELVNADLKDTVLTESFRKTYTVKLEKHRLYQIILTSKAFSPHVRLENSVREQIDAGGGKAGFASIHVRPAQTDDYEIIATSQNGGAMGSILRRLIAKSCHLPQVLGAVNKNPAKCYPDLNHALLSLLFYLPHASD